jgi:hypothetical protein
VEEAMRARDVLSGRKIDTEKGCVIKAEMAKKNLHTKRGISSSDPNKMYAGNSGAYRRRSTLDGMEHPYYKSGSVDYSAHYDSGLAYSGEYYSSSAPGSYNNQYNDDLFDPFGPPTADTDLLSTEYYQSDNCLSPREDFDGKLPPLFGTSQSSRGFSSVLYNSDELLSKSLGSMTMSDVPGAETFGGRSSSFSYTTLPGADQNPPCNTLYVGNLPNDNCEEELRQMFQCCPGYKRLSFKTRPNGPMCFVEVICVHVV